MSFDFTFEVLSVNNANQVLVKYMPVDLGLTEFIRNVRVPFGTAPEIKDYIARHSPQGEWQRQLDFQPVDPVPIEAITGDQDDVIPFVSPTPAIDLAKQNKVSEINQEFYTRSQADGINVRLPVATGIFAGFGEDATPNAGQTRFYTNISAGNVGIDTVNAYVDINDVNNFDAVTDVVWAV